MSIYIILILEAFLFIFINVVDELYNKDVSIPSKKRSNKIAFFMLIAIILFCIFVTYQYLKNHNKFNEEKNWMVKQLFIDLKDNSVARFNTVSFILIRISSVLLLICWESLTYEIKTAVFTFFHICFAGYLLKARPSKDTENNIIESFLQIMYIIE